jgi:tetratricopeptide (TPR) repeat protein
MATMKLHLLKIGATLWLLALSASTGQAQLVDSLHRLLAKQRAMPDTTLVNVYQQLSLYYNNRLTNIDSANYYTDQGLQLATKLNYEKGMARGNMIKSNMYNEKGEIGKAFSAIQTAYQIYLKLGIEREAGQALYGLGNVYLSAGDPENAIKSFLEASRLLEKDKKNPALSAAYINLAIALNRLERYAEALGYYRKAVAICQKNKDLPREIFALVNAVGSFNLTKSYDSAWHYADQAYQKSNKIAFPPGIIRSLIQKANVAIYQGNYRAALRLGEEILAQAEKYDQKGYWGNAHQKIAVAYDSLKQYDQALEHAKKALFFTKKFRVAGADPLEDEGKILTILAHIYKNQGNPALALSHYERYASLKDSVLGKEKITQMNALASLYETQKKEQEILALNQQAQMQDIRLQQKNTLLLSLAGGAGLLLLIGVLFYRQRRMLNTQRLADLEQRLLRSRLNPHFWFNALTSVHSLLLDKQNLRQAAQYLTKIASIMRQSLESTYQDLIPVDEEIAFLENYLAIQQMRTDNQLSFKILVDPNLPISEILMPSMLLQPFVENAIEHGLKNLQVPGEITISFGTTGGLLQLTVEDNGQGLGNPALDQSTSHRSRAMEITRERLALLQAKYKRPASLAIANREGEPGVRVSIVLPEMNH